MNMPEVKKEDSEQVPAQTTDADSAAAFEEAGKIADGEPAKAEPAKTGAPRKEEEGVPDKGIPPKPEEEPPKQEPKPESEMTVAERLEVRAQEVEREQKESQESERFWTDLTHIEKDAREIAASDAYGEWIDKQPEDIKRMANTNDVSKARYVLQLFRAREKIAGPSQEPGNVVDLIKELGLGDAKIRTAEGEITLAKFAEDYGDIAHASLVMAKELSQRAITDAVKGMPTADQVRQMQQELIAMRFWTQVHREHPDGQEISESNEFKGWKEKQPDRIKVLCATGDWRDAVRVIDAYKESIVKGQESKEKEVAGEKKKRLDDLHRHSLKPVKTVEPITEEFDEHRTFEDMAEKEEKNR